MGGESHPEGQLARESASGESESEGERASGDWSGLYALCAVARFHQVAADPATLAHQPACARTSPSPTRPRRSRP